MSTLGDPNHFCDVWAGRRRYIADSPSTTDGRNEVGGRKAFPRPVAQRAGRLGALDTERRVDGAR